jgi:hypothetical protein
VQGCVWPDSFERRREKLWKTYKQLLQLAVKSLGFEIGFLFQEDKAFKDGVGKFRNSHPLLAAKLRQDYENFLADNRNGWQAKLKEFRNDGVEHPKGGTLPRLSAGFSPVRRIHGNRGF